MAITIPANITLPNLPYKVFGSSVQVFVDSNSKIFVAAITNGSPKGGLYVWRLDGNTYVELLSPGSSQTWSGKADILSDGNLYALGLNEYGEQPTLWRIPTWGTVPYVVTSTTTTGSTSTLDQVARDQSSQALTVAQQAMERANYAKDLATSALSRPESLSESRIGEIAWAKAGDRFAAIWNEMLDYNIRPQLLSVIWNHALQLLEYAGVHSDRLNKTIKPGQTDIARNPPERLRM